MDRDEKLRNEFIKRSGRMRALNYLAKAHPIEFEELLVDGQEEAAQLYDNMGRIFDAFKITKEQGV